MAEYRSGHYEEAIRWLDESRRLTRLGIGCTSIVISQFQTEDDLFLALSYEWLGDHPRARESLDRATHVLDTEFPRPGEANLVNVGDWIFCQVVRREAEELINRKRPTTKPAAAN